MLSYLRTNASESPPEKVWSGRAPSTHPTTYTLPVLSAAALAAESSPSVPNWRVQSSSGPGVGLGEGDGVGSGVGVEVGVGVVAATGVAVDVARGTGVGVTSPAIVGFATRSGVWFEVVSVQATPSSTPRPRIVTAHEGICLAPITLQRTGHPRNARRAVTRKSQRSEYHSATLSTGRFIPGAPC